MPYSSFPRKTKVKAHVRVVNGGRRHKVKAFLNPLRLVEKHHEIQHAKTVKELHPHLDALAKHKSRGLLGRLWHRKEIRNLQKHVIPSLIHKASHHLSRSGHAYQKKFLQHPAATHSPSSTHLTPTHPPAHSG